MHSGRELQPAIAGQPAMLTYPMGFVLDFRVLSSVRIDYAITHYEIHSNTYRELLYLVGAVGRIARTEFLHPSLNVPCTCSREANLPGAKQ